MNTPPILRAAWVPRDPEAAFAIFTQEIGAWWPLPSHGMFGGEAGGLCFRNGQLVEHATDGRETVWGQVLAWEPPERLVITWYPGQDHDDASQVTVTFSADGDGTQVLLRHDGWEAFGDAAMARRRGYAGPGAWGSVLDHYCDITEPPLELLDLTELADAYDAFFAEAERGGFGDPLDEAWNADEVLAHVALNDAAMVAVCQALAHGRPARFDNVICQDRAVLAGWIDRAGSREALVDRCRVSARQVQAALRRLSPQQLATEVHCQLLHDGEVMVDAPRPWHAVAVEVQATRHLPAHIEQLAELRAT